MMTILPTEHANDDDDNDSDDYDNDDDSDDDNDLCRNNKCIDGDNATYRTCSR